MKNIPSPLPSHVYFVRCKAGEKRLQKINPYFQRIKCGWGEIYLCTCAYGLK